MTEAIEKELFENNEEGSLGRMFMQEFRPKLVVTLSQQIQKEKERAKAIKDEQKRRAKLDGIAEAEDILERMKGADTFAGLKEIYKDLGKDFVKELNGIFAFALWDRRDRCLYSDGSLALERPNKPRIHKEE